MKATAVIFGGFMMPQRVLAKYADVYGPTTRAVRLSTTCLIAGTWYRYDALHMELRERGGPLHVHAISGGCHYLYRFMTMYPEHRERVVSQVYDSPCGSNGLPIALCHLYGLPAPLARVTARAVLKAFPDCVETTRRWMDGPLFDPSIPTGIVTSTRDPIMCVDRVREMTAAWGMKPEMLVTDSMHVQSLRDYPSRYKDFCTGIRDGFSQGSFRLASE
jgi:hypothetical protein